jgi:hypothetical protein
MKKVILFGLLLVSCTSGQEQTREQKMDVVSSSPSEGARANKDYQLVDMGDGIFVEKFDSTNKDENRYNHNNRIFSVGSSFTYAYEYVDTMGKVHYSKQTGNGWEFVSSNNSDQQTIREVIIQVQPGGMGDEYNQTVISYHYPPHPDYSASGVIENEKNIWMHPPRDGLFRILELNPFPYIQAPYQVGREWNWALSIGSHWSDKRWKEWQGRINNMYHYQITSLKEINTRLGKISCYEISSTAQSELGKTALVAYFNEKHGFVKLIYTNIDGSKLTLDLVEHKTK